MSQSADDGSVRKRVRTGCLTCRRRHRKCDETRPVCVNCKSKKIECNWTITGLFSDSNSRFVTEDYISVVPKTYPGSGIMIVNEGHKFDKKRSSPKRSRSESLASIHTSDNETVQSLLSLNGSRISSANLTTGTLALDHNSAETPISSTSPMPNSGISEREFEEGSTHTASLQAILNSSTGVDSPSDFGEYQHVHKDVGKSPGSSIHNNATMSILDHFAKSGSSLSPNDSSMSHRDVLSIAGITASANDLDMSGLGGSVNAIQTPHSLSSMPGPSPDSLLSPPKGAVAMDLNFGQGDASFIDLQNILKDYMLSTARSIGPSRATSPVFTATEDEYSTVANSHGVRNDGTLSNHDKARLMRNYIDEVASWLDMFDNNRHFAIVLPRLALQSHALFYSLLAISSRQMERVNKNYPSALTLELYQQSIQYLLPSVQSKNIEIIAACSVLCCLEMMSSSPQNWRNHLEGCAALFSSAGIHGFCGGLAQALFWCFARMDLSSSVIGDESTIIKMQHWIPEGTTLETAGDLFRSQPSWDMYANYAVFLCSRVMNIIASDSPLVGQEYDDEWERLWEELSVWRERIPVEMKPLLSFEEDPNSPFPTILYGNAPAISGNQLYHTACILLVQNKPRLFKLPKNTPSLLWHAKQICGISMTNTHHGCWNNALQPLWVAGRLMSHHSEHAAILKILHDIEKSTGWAMKWRGEDLKEFWGIE